MADEDSPQEEEQGNQEGGASGGPLKNLLANKRKLVFILIGIVALLGLGGGGYFAYTTMFASPQMASQSEDQVEKKISKLPSVYFDLPEMVVNLSVNDKRAQYLKIKIALEAHEQTAIDALQPVMPRVLDMFQIYLRELRSSDLEGSAGIFRLKEELLRRINLAIYPNRINRVLFKEIIIQ